MAWVVTGCCGVSVAINESDFSTPDLFDGRTRKPVVKRNAAVLRGLSRMSLPVEVEVQVCGWCGVDRAGGCGACSDLPYVKR